MDSCESLTSIIKNWSTLTLTFGNDSLFKRNICKWNVECNGNLTPPPIITIQLWSNSHLIKNISKLKYKGSVVHINVYVV